MWLMDCPLATKGVSSSPISTSRSGVVRIPILASRSSFLYYICAWTDRGQHINFGDAPADPSDEMDMAAELFWRSIDYVRKIESEGLCSSEG